MNKRIRKWFSLLEMTALLMLVGIVLVFTATIFHGGFRIERAGARAFRNIVHRHELADQFRADVADTIATPENWEDFEAGPTCLILTKAENDHVIYEWRGKNLSRIERNADDERKRTFPIEGERLEVAFVRDGRLITLRLQESNKPAPSRIREIAAALPGGSR
jgi:hypothetical protein